MKTLTCVTIKAVFDLRLCMAVGYFLILIYFRSTVKVYVYHIIILTLHQPVLSNDGNVSRGSLWWDSNSRKTGLQRLRDALTTRPKSALRPIIQSCWHLENECAYFLFIILYLNFQIIIFVYMIKRIYTTYTDRCMYTSIALALIHIWLTCRELSYPLLLRNTKAYHAINAI